MIKEMIKKASILSLLLVGISASAATIDLSSLHNNGSATHTGSELRLTTASNSQTGSTYISTPYTIAPSLGFSTSFELFIHGGNGADGMTFVIQNDPAAAGAIGSAGIGMGYSGLTNSVAIEFDTYYNSGLDPNNNHIGIDINGNLNSVDTHIPAFNLDGGDHIFAWIDYDGVNLKVFISNVNAKPGVPAMVRAIDLAAITGGQAYFGFSGATGGLNNIHDILNWNLNVGTTAIPLSNSAKALLAMLFAFAAFFMMHRRKISINPAK